MKKQMTVGVLVLMMAAGTAMAQESRGDGKSRPGNAEFSKERIERMEQRQAERFQRMDTDGDGRLSVDELHEGLQRERAERMHRWMDRDGDGFVSPEEFSAMQKKRFSKKGNQRKLDKQGHRTYRHGKGQADRRHRSAQ